MLLVHVATRYVTIASGFMTSGFMTSGFISSDFMTFGFLGGVPFWVAGVDQDACPEPKDGGCTGGAAVRTLSRSHRYHDNARAT